MNVQDEIKALKQRIAEPEQQVDEEQAFPKYKDFYWGVNAKGKVFCDTWEGFKFEKDMLSIGNVYQTENEAVLALGKLKVEAELLKFSRPFKEDEYNYFIQINPSHNDIVIDSDDCYQTQGTIYFESMTIANEAIDTVGADRIKKYIFGVEE